MTCAAINWLAGWVCVAIGVFLGILIAAVFGAPR